MPLLASFFYAGHNRGSFEIIISIDKSLSNRRIGIFYRKLTTTCIAGLQQPTLVS